jgi:hypothetical protein
MGLQLTYSALGNTRVNHSFISASLKSPMSRYIGLTERLRSEVEPVVVLTFEELDQIVGGLPASARTYHAWWANKRSSQPHARFWLDAGRRATPDFANQRAVFTQDDSAENEPLTPPTPDASEAVAEYVEGSLSLERDLENHLISSLDSLEPGLTFVSRQESTDVGRVDILARAADGQTVIIELKAGDARDSAIGQIARYIGWYARAEEKHPRAYLIAGGFPEPVRYAAGAIPGLKLVTYRISFAFAEATI